MPAVETVANSKVVSALSQILLQLFQEVYEFVLYELVSQKKKKLYQEVYGLSFHSQKITRADSFRDRYTKPTKPKNGTQTDSLLPCFKLNQNQCS